MISVVKNRKRVRKQKGFVQKEVAFAADNQGSNCAEIESGQRDVSVEALKVVQVFGMKEDEILHFENTNFEQNILIAK